VNRQTSDRPSHPACGGVHRRKYPAAGAGQGRVADRAVSARRAAQLAPGLPRAVWLAAPAADRTDHPLARKKTIRACDRIQYSLIATPKDSTARKALERISQRPGLRRQWHEILENTNTDVIGKYVAAGVGIALMYAGKEDCRKVPGLQVRVFDPHEDTLAIGLFIRKGAYLSKPAQEFRQTVRRCLAVRGQCPQS
jgi:DNA-binding transcriptional LysR family regulator